MKQTENYISCIVPVHNEQGGVKKFLDALVEKLLGLTNKYEIIVVDDGSTDNTVKIITDLTSINNNIKLLKLSRNFGKEIALTAGLDHSSGDAVILIDSDFQHPLDLLPKFIAHWQQGYEMVYGVRTNRDDESLLKRVFTKCFYGLLRVITKVNITANAGDFRLLDRKVVQALNTCVERGRFMKGLYAWVGFKSIAVPFQVAKREIGKSSWNYGNLAELAITGITSFSNAPLRVWSLIGLSISAISFSYAMYLIYHTIRYGVEVPGYASIMVAVMFFGGVQLLSIGILGEYIARIFNEVKQRPKYLISEKLGFK
ncbi:MAG: glycosyltransferase [Legionellales bacterium]|nr:MAG: glycosyltransferase [Legionellales bacterium]